ncbi:MRN complex-interacting protein isoform X2 [Piliocolobus tephrosceles]|uniref:MRN complex-interacting protein isoform X2 n=1 Tax=Piliocolobus tephrosceles TaxID=591936 RepID=UPI000E6B3A0F|nr:MRN complex-interacting protein isoform X2 [Piliocolobus tephrosceles]
MQSARARLAGYYCTDKDGAASVLSGSALLQLPPLPGAPGKKECQVDMQSLWREAVLFAVPRHRAPASELPVPSGSEMDGVVSGKMHLCGRGRETNTHTHLPNLKLGWAQGKESPRDCEKMTEESRRLGKGRGCRWSPQNLIPSQLEELSPNYKFLGEAIWLAQADSDVHLWSGQLGLGLSREELAYQAYGEGSGADCRRHVQKLNLLQGQVSELPLRSLEETVSADEEENVGHQQAGNVKQQEKSQPSESRWLKYLEKDSQELELEGRGVCFSKQPSSKREEPGPCLSQDLPRKRKWSQSTAQPPCSLGIQDSGGSEVAWEPQKGQAGSIWKAKQGSSPCLRENSADCSARELRGPGKELWSPAQNSSHVDREQPRPLQRDPRPAGLTQAKQGTPRAQASREGLRRPTDAVPLPRATHPTTYGPEAPCRKTSWDARTPWAEGGPLVQETQNARLLRLCDLFTTGEDFDDDL